MVCLDDRTEGIYKLITDFFKNAQMNVKKLTGFSSDGASVMRGVMGFAKY